MEEQLVPDLSDYLAAIKRRRFMLLIIALPVAASGLVLALGLPSIYESSGLVQFNRATISGELQNSSQTPQSSYVDLQRNYADQYVANLRDAVLNPVALARIVAQARGLSALPRDPDEATAEILKHATMQTVRARVLDPESGREREILPGFSVSFGSANPRTAQTVANMLTSAVIQASRHNLLVRASAADQFYNNEAQRYRTQISTLEGQLADFKEKHFGELPELTNANMSAIDRMERDQESVEVQIQQLRQNRTFLLQQLAQAQAGAGGEADLLQKLQAEYSQKAAVYGENHPDIVALRRKIDALRSGGAALQGMTLTQQLAAEQQQLQLQRQRYSDDYPDVKETKRRIGELQQRIKSGEKAEPFSQSDNPTVVQLRTALAGNQNESTSLQGHSEMLRRQIAQLQKRVETTPMVEREYQQLTRGLELARAKYDELSKGQMDSQLTAQAITSGRADELRIVTAPVLPAAPAKPRRLGIALVGMIVALVLGLSTVIAAEVLDQTVRGSRDLRRVLRLAPLAVVPRIQDRGALRLRRLKVVAVAGCVGVASIAALITARNLL